ncbi:MAG: hypothetical protein ABR520_00750 [Mycobacteriales bacterium]|nr:hypothetical protein [Frankia sp.]
MKRHVLALGVALVVLSGGATAHARKPQVVDPDGDAMTREAAYDVTSATFDSVRQAVRGRTNVRMRLTLTLGGPVSTAPGHVYAVTARYGTCTLYVEQAYYTTGPYPFWFTYCGASPNVQDTSSATGPLGVPQVAGNTVTWQVWLKGLPPQVKVGTKLTNLGAFTSLHDEYRGYTPAEVIPETAIDLATSNATYVVGH